MIDLSIHLITYNNEKHVEETIESILKQKVNFSYEIVVGDDCSTDSTFNIISKYESNYPKLFNIKKNKTRLGILENFKITLDRCKGNYIFDIAGDDLLKHEDALQKMVNVLKSDSSLGFVDSGFDELHEKDKSIKHFCNQNLLDVPKEVYENKLLLGLISPVGICFNRAYLYQFVDFDKYINMKITIEDYPILVDLSMNTNFETIKESLHIYRVHDDSYSHKKSFENLLFLKNQMKMLFIYFSEKYNFQKDNTRDYFNNHDKELLFLAGYFEKKELGKEMYKKIISKSIKDHIHFYASQYTFIRKLISSTKKIINNFLK